MININHLAMFRLFISAFLLLCCFTLSFGQEEEPVILIAATSKVMYTSPEGNKPSQILQGALIQPDGMVRIKGNGTATFQFGRHIVQHTGKEAVKLSSLFEKGAGKTSLGFNNRFAEYVEEAFVMAYYSSGDPNAPWSQLATQKGMGDGWTVKGGTRDTLSGATRGTGDGWTVKGGTRDTLSGATRGTGDGWTVKGGTRDTLSGATRGTGDGWTVKGGTRDTLSGATRGTGDGWGVQGGTKNGAKTGDGWGGTGNQIDALQPFGYLSSGAFLFAWSRPAGAAVYIVEIMDRDGKIVQKGSTSDTSLVLNLSSTAFEIGETYTWIVRTNGTNAIRSNELYFEVKSVEERERIVNRVQNTPTFEGSGEATRPLMLAVGFEDAQWNGDALAHYANAQVVAGKKSVTPKLMHSAFWNRKGVPAKAVSVFNSKK
jgi:hypothetical protein